MSFNIFSIANFVFPYGLIGSQISFSFNNLFDSELISDKEIYVLTPRDISGEELSEIIKINLYSRSKIKRIEDLSKLQLNQHIWITNRDYKKFEDFKTTYKSKQIAEWVLKEKV